MFCLPPVRENLEDRLPGMFGTIIICYFNSSKHITIISFSFLNAYENEIMDFVHNFSFLSKKSRVGKGNTSKKMNNTRAICQASAYKNKVEWTPNLAIHGVRHHAVPPLQIEYYQRQCPKFQYLCLACMCRHNLCSLQ